MVEITSVLFCQAGKHLISWFKDGNIAADFYHRSSNIKPPKNIREPAQYCIGEDELGHCNRGAVLFFGKGFHNAVCSLGIQGINACGSNLDNDVPAIHNSWT